MKNLLLTVLLFAVTEISAQGSFIRHGATWYFDDPNSNGQGAWNVGDGKDYYGTDITSVPFPAYVQGSTITGKAISKEAWERGLPAAWAKGYRGEGIRIAVLDTGCDTLPGLHPAGGYNFIGHNTDYSDPHGHGTARCSNIISQPVGGTGYTGNAPAAQLWVGKVITAQNTTQASYITDALKWCDSMNFDIILCAWQFYDPAILPLLDRLARKGTWIVCSAGNVPMDQDSSSITYPAAFRSTIAVGGVQGGSVTKRDNSRYAYNSRLPVQGKGISWYGFTIGLCHFRDNTYGNDFGSSYTGGSEVGFLAIYRQWLRSKGRDLLQYQAIADLQTRWADRAPDGRCVAGGMGFIQ